LYSKASLKLQNRTRGGSIESDAVDNIPLYGKCYEGSGNYFSYYRDTFGATAPFSPNGENTTFVVNNAYCTFDNGLAVADNSNVQTLREPPPGTMFDRVKKTGKAHLDPGMIKTSVLTASKKFSFNALQRYLGVNRAQENQQNMNIGKYRFFLLEKMVHAEADTAENQIQVAWEHDIKLAAIVTCPSATVSHYMIEQTAPLT